MTARTRPDGDFVSQQAARMHDLLRQRGTLPRDELEYLAVAADKLRDERLKACIAELIGWSDDDRAEIETFVAIAIEVMKKTNTSKIREAARIVQLRYLNRELERKENDR